MALSPTPFCSYCKVNSSISKLFLYQAYKVVHYYGRDHQVAHTENHKDQCNAIKESQQALDQEETELRSHPGDIFTPPNLFEEQVGLFWVINETRGYITARHALVQALLMVPTHAAVEAAHGHLMDIVRLCRSDYTGIREPVPALALRLGKDQECYDFCKWWVTIGDDGHYNWGKMSLPYLDIKNADVFESPHEHIVRRNGSLSHTAAIALLKIRLLIDVCALQNSSVIGHKVPREIFNSVRGHLVSSSVVAKNKDIMKSHDQAPLIQNLEVQVQDLYAAVKNLNQYFWPTLLNPREHLHPRSGFGIVGLWRGCELYFSTAMMPGRRHQELWM